MRGSFKNGTTLKLSRQDGKLPYIRITTGPQRHMYLHMLVAMAKLGRPLQGDETVDHIDGNSLNNHPDNLRVIPRAENTRYAMERRARGYR